MTGHSWWHPWAYISSHSSFWTQNFFYLEIALHLCNEPAHLQDPSHVGLHRWFWTSVRSKNLFSYRLSYDLLKVKAILGFSDTAVLVTLNALSTVPPVIGIVAEVMLVMSLMAMLVIFLMMVIVIHSFQVKKNQGVGKKLERESTHRSVFLFHISGGEVWRPSQKPPLCLGGHQLLCTLPIHACLVQVPQSQVNQRDQDSRAWSLSV